MREKHKPPEAYSRHPKKGRYNYIRFNLDYSDYPDTDRSDVNWKSPGIYLNLQKIIGFTKTQIKRKP